MNKPSIKEIRNKYQVFYRNAWYLRTVSRKLSVYFAWFFARTSITPNQISLLMILMGIIGGVFLAMPGYVNGLLGVLFLNLFLILDCTDGEVARIKGKVSSKGLFLDLIANDIVFVSIFSGLCFRMYQDSFVLIAGFGSIIFFLLSKLFPLYANVADEKLTGEYLRPNIFNTKFKLMALYIIQDLATPPHVIAIMTLGAIFNIFPYLLFSYGIFLFLYFSFSLAIRFKK